MTEICQDFVCHSTPNCASYFSGYFCDGGSLFLRGVKK